MEANRRLYRWEQGLLRSGTAAYGYSEASFLVLDPAFMEIINEESTLELLAEADAHEGGVYNPEDDCVYFSSSRQTDPKPNAQIMKVHLETGKVEVVKSETEVANGMVLGKDGALLVCNQGIRPHGGFIEHLNLKTGESKVLVDNWYGRRFNSPNDVVVKSDGSIWFTDPDYAWVQGFGAEPEVKNQVYRLSPSGVVDAVADGFVKPNGLAFSPDESLLYVTDTGSTIGDGTVDIQKPHSVTVIDVDENGASLKNKRHFASIATIVEPKYEGVGCPDGIKVDTEGRVYIANLDGVQVFDKRGKLLGMIKIPGATNMGFAGRDLQTLVILNGTAIYKITLSAKGAGLTGQICTQKPKSPTAHC